MVGRRSVAVHFLFAALVSGRSPQTAPEVGPKSLKKKAGPADIFG